MKAIITGGTGMVGSLVLKHCLNDDRITQVTSLVRRKTGLKNSKLVEVEIDDFCDYTNFKEHFKGIDMAFFCIGVYTGQVKDDLFKKITVDYAVEFAKILEKHSPSSRLCLLSGAGADRTEKSRTSFARYKGMAENRISELSLQFYSFRPAYIYPVTPRKEPNLVYKITRFLYPLIRLFGSNASIKSTDLARAMFEVGCKGSDKNYLENADILNLLETH